MKTTNKPNSNFKRTYRSLKPIGWGLFVIFYISIATIPMFFPLVKTTNLGLYPSIQEHFIFLCCVFLIILGRRFARPIYHKISELFSKRINLSYSDLFSLPLVSIGTIILTTVIAKLNIPVILLNSCSVILIYLLVKITQKTSGIISMLWKSWGWAKLLLILAILVMYQFKIVINIGPILAKALIMMMLMTIALVGTWVMDFVFRKNYEKSLSAEAYEYSDSKTPFESILICAAILSYLVSLIENPTIGEMAKYYDFLGFASLFFALLRK